MRPTPRFDALVAAAEEAQPVCQGTIRFSLAADYGQLITGLRLRRFSASPAAADAKAEAAFAATNAVTMLAAEQELQSAYASEFDMPPAAAGRGAARAVRAALAGAFNLCETG